MKPLPPIPAHVFKFYCQKVLPAVYDDSLSYYEVLCKLTAKLNELISADTAQNAAIEELQNYFSSLNIDSAVLAGLQTMAEQGTLTTLLTAYVELAKSFAFPTLADLKNAQNLKAGTICQTLGTSSYQTGDGSFYYVRLKTEADVPDDDNIVAFSHTYDPVIIAEKIPDPLAGDVSTLNTRLDGTIDDLLGLSTKYDNEIGDLTALITPTITSIVAAINSGYTKNGNDINDINASLTTINDNIGTMSNLATTVTTSLVAAINSVLSTNWSIANGGTGASTAEGARVALGLFTERKQFERSSYQNNSWTINNVNLTGIDYLEIYYYYNPPGTSAALDSSVRIKFKDAGPITNLWYIYPHASGSDKLMEIASTQYNISYNSSGTGTLTLTTGTRFISTITNSSISTVQTEYNQFYVYRVIAYKY